MRDAEKQAKAIDTQIGTCYSCKQIQVLAIKILFCIFMYIEVKYKIQKIGFV